MASYSSVNWSVNVPLSVSNTTGVSLYGNRTKIKGNERLTDKDQELLICHRIWLWKWLVVLRDSWPLIGHFCLTLTPSLRISRDASSEIHPLVSLLHITCFIFVSWRRQLTETTLNDLASVYSYNSCFRGYTWKDTSQDLHLNPAFITNATSTFLFPMWAWQVSALEISERAILHRWL